MPENLSDYQNTYSGYPDPGTYAGGLIGYLNYSGSLTHQGINYGSVTASAPEKDNVHLGALVGAMTTQYNNNVITNCVDLTEYPTGQTHRGLIGRTERNGTNYTMYSDVPSLTPAFGTIKVVTLDQDNGVDQNRPTEGLYYANFVFRNRLIHELQEPPERNEDNGLVYEDIDHLSPYLRAYMKQRFGNDICGAYVVSNGPLELNSGDVS